jgi:hypothetical protein
MMRTTLRKESMGAVYLTQTKRGCGVGLSIPAAVPGDDRIGWRRDTAMKPAPVAPCDPLQTPGQ